MVRCWGWGAPRKGKRVCKEGEGGFVELPPDFLLLGTELVAKATGHRDVPHGAGRSPGLTNVVGGRRAVENDTVTFC